MTRRKSPWQKQEVHPRKANRKAKGKARIGVKFFDTLSVQKMRPPKDFRVLCQWPDVVYQTSFRKGKGDSPPFWPFSAHPPTPESFEKAQRKTPVTEQLWICGDFMNRAVLKIGLALCSFVEMSGP